MRSIVTSTVNQTSKGVLNFLYENVYDIAFFVNTDHADVLSYEEMNKIYLKGAVSDHFIQFPTKLANSWLRAYILNAPEVCNINRGQTLETKVSLESSNLKIL